MEAIGAIIIFFSWILTNAITQRFTALKQSLETAQGNFRLYNTLHEVRAMVNSVGAELIQSLPKSKNATRFRAGKHHIAEVDLIREKFNQQYVNAQQVRELIDFVAQVNSLSLAIEQDNNTHREIASMLDVSSAQVGRVLASLRKHPVREPLKGWIAAWLAPGAGGISGADMMDDDVQDGEGDKCYV